MQAQFSAIEMPPAVHAPLNCADPCGAVAQRIVLRHFAELLEQRAPVLENRDVEAVHRIRVAARRTRTALQTFAALWPQPDAARYLRELAGFADQFNAARDLDVMIIYLGEQLKDAEPQRASALRWLLERNTELRRREQRKLERALERFERREVACRFVEFFATHPAKLWPGLPKKTSADDKDANGLADIESSNDNEVSTIHDQHDEPITGNDDEENAQVDRENGEVNDG